ncbi:flagellin N-terminal helical domain-containing protein [Alkalihalobacterium elongatum]|uniref:flagellin N-terminal helical domain-containing protein n=1 Tax=Alkalihalobacterium elongatum TaxID=2675466 RepID=UPI001C1FB6C2|nr:flagellin [Alkalihalobacterium elongatum]
MIINNNISALNNHRQMGINQAGAQNSMQKLSSGLRINKAGDDAAGLAISEKMRGQIRGLDQASRNAQDGISLIQTAEGALNETHSILQRMRELAVQAANDTNTDTDRAELQKEVDQLVQEIDRIADTTEFNTKKLLNGDLAGARVSEESFKIENNDSKGALTIEATDLGEGDLTDGTFTVKITGFETDDEGAVTSYTLSVADSKGNLTEDISVDVGDENDTAIAGVTITVSDIDDPAEAAKLVGKEATITTRAAVEEGDSKSLSFQIGANSSQTISVGINDMSASALKVDEIDLTSASKAGAAISAINQAIENVSAERSNLGAFQNRLEHTIANLGTSSENLQAAESRIRDVDMAREVMEMTKNNILSQASQAMLAQANQAPQAVLQLLG